MTIYFTGGGQTNPGGVNGSTLKWLTQNISMTVGPAAVPFGGSAPGFVDGVGQLNIPLATGAPYPTEPLVVTVAGVTGNIEGFKAVVFRHAMNQEWKCLRRLNYGTRQLRYRRPSSAACETYVPAALNEAVYRQVLADSWSASGRPSGHSIGISRLKPPRPLLPDID